MGQKKTCKALERYRGSRSGTCITIAEHLEPRRLLSQVNVTSFGASPNGGGDDTAAIRSAINASAAGDTIYFAAGSYNISSELVLKGQRSYVGADGAVLRGDPSKHIFRIQQNDIRVENFTFVGKPIKIDTPNNVKVANLVINDNVFDISSASGVDNSGITFTTGLQNTQITNNTFSPIGNHMAIYGYYWDGLLIANNSFLNGEQGLHVDDINDSSRNMTIEQNYFSGLARMGVEYQGGGNNTIVQDNWYEKPVMTGNFNDNNETFAFSIPADRSNGTITRRNVIWAPERPDGVGVRIGFETGGDGSLIENNYVYGINQVLANTDGVGTTSALAQNNHYHQVLDGLVGRGLTKINNGPQVDLQWLIDRGRPGPNRRFGSSGGTPAPAPAPTPSGPVIGLPSGTTALSDLNWASMTNGWGPVEEDRSNGESGANDGKTITIGGQSYAKGLGAHAGSEIVYNLNKQYGTFFSDIGVDEEVGSRGSVVFQVWVDGVKAYESGKQTGSMGAQSININVTGKSTLKLVVTNAGDGTDSDHGDWANARLSPAGSTPAPSGSGTWLSDLNWTSAVNGWGAVHEDRSNGEVDANDGKGITIRGTSYAKGLGVHANSDIHYNLNSQYDTFTSDIGIDNETSGRGSVVFQVYLDGKLLFDSGVVRGSDAVKKVSVDVTGGKDLRLVVTGAGDGIDFDHADWAGAKLLP